MALYVGWLRGDGTQDAQNTGDCFMDVFASSLEKVDCDWRMDWVDKNGSVRKPLRSCKREYFVREHRFGIEENEGRSSLSDFGNELQHAPADNVGFACA